MKYRGWRADRYTVRAPTAQSDHPLLNPAERQRPSPWLNNETITLGSGSATQYYYMRGMPQQAEWFADFDVVPQGLETLLDTEATPTGDRPRGGARRQQETILMLRMHGPPPAKPTVANPRAADGRADRSALHPWRREYLGAGAISLATREREHAAVRLLAGPLLAIRSKRNSVVSGGPLGGWLCR